MVGSSRTWNTDEPGLGRPKALPSSAPRRTSVIWMVLSGRHMPVNVHLHTQRLKVSHPVTWTHATTTNPLLSSSATYIHLRPPSPPHPTLRFQSLSFRSHPLPSPSDCVFSLWSHQMSRCVCCWMCFVFTGVCMFACVALSGSVIHKKNEARYMNVNLLSDLSLCLFICALWWPCMSSTHILSSLRSFLYLPFLSCP